jgi:hypothetical protein
MSARWSVGDRRPMCQAIRCRQLAAPVTVEVSFSKRGWTWPGPPLRLRGRVRRHELDAVRGVGAHDWRVGRAFDRVGDERWPEELTWTGLAGSGTISSRVWQWRV